jgi:hypothetical protein
MREAELMPDTTLFTWRKTMFLESISSNETISLMHWTGRVPKLPGHEAVNDEVDAAVERETHVRHGPHDKRIQFDGVAAVFEPVEVGLQDEELVHVQADSGGVADQEEEADRKEDLEWMEEKIDFLCNSYFAGGEFRVVTSLFLWCERVRQVWLSTTGEL